MSDAFARDRQHRKTWWNDHLWLQMVTIAALCVIAGAISGMQAGPLLAGTAVFLILVYVLARLILRAQRQR